MDIVHQDLPYGMRLNLHFSPCDFAIVEIYEDQFSVNWTTPLDEFDFIKLWHEVGDKSGAVVLFEKREPVELYAFQLSELRYERFGRGRPQLVRVWLDDASVAWQRLQQALGDQRGDEGTINQCTITGIASDTADYSRIRDYISLTSTSKINEMAGELVEAFAKHAYFKESRMHSLRSVLKSFPH